MSWSAPNLNPDDHCFFDRFGGVSQGPYDSLNFNILSQDKRENIDTNIAIVGNRFHKDATAVALVSQNVSSTAVYIEKAAQFQVRADGIVTDKPDIILGITTADCAPVLFADYRNGIIGAAHAGWRGAVRGIMENTLSLMLNKGAELKNIVAAIGPCLQKKSFETKADMLAEFITQDPCNKVFFVPTDAEHYLFDAEAYLIHRLQKFGLENIATSGIDTYTDDAYFSYRRNCHRNLVSCPADFPIHLSTITI